jgi:hypothetical protein
MAHKKLAETQALLPPSDCQSHFNLLDLNNITIRFNCMTGTQQTNQAAHMTITYKATSLKPLEVVFYHYSL